MSRCDVSTSCSQEETEVVVLGGLRGQSVAALCTEYGISQTQYYQKWDKFLSNAYQAFEADKLDRAVERLTKQNERLKGLVEELTYELKKSDGWDGMKRGAYQGVAARNAGLLGQSIRHGFAMMRIPAMSAARRRLASGHGRRGRVTSSSIGVAHTKEVVDDALDLIL